MENGEDAPVQPGGDLKRALRGWQIYFILASTIIGEGIFSGDGRALEAAGPGAALVGLLVVGVIVVSVMECVSEFVQLFPCSNAIVEYIRAFLDEDLAWCCGFAYWYTWASVVAALNIRAANFATYWGMSGVWQTAAFFVIAPAVMWVINMCGVYVFGVIETVGGFLKLAMVFGTGIVTAHLYSIRPDPAFTPINDGFQADTAVVTSKSAGFFYGIPILVYSFLGVESVAVTAFEAYDSRSLRGPSKLIASTIFLLYLFCLLCEVLLTEWNNSDLKNLYIGVPSSNSTTPIRKKYNMAVAAAEKFNMSTLASFLNGCYILSVLSGANSALYVASRTLYGLGRKVQPTRPLSRGLAWFSGITRHRRVPARALAFSWICFFWLPFLNNLEQSSNGDVTIEAIFEILETTASEMCLIVWAALCASYIRFHHWARKNKEHLSESAQKFVPETDTYVASTVFGFWQPLAAWIGLFGSLIIVLILAGSSLWNGFTGRKFAVAYVAPLVIIISLLVRKAVLWPSRRARHDLPHVHGWVKAPEAETLSAVFEGLRPLTEADEARWRDNWRQKQADAFKVWLREKGFLGQLKDSVQIREPAEAEQAQPRASEQTATTFLDSSSPIPYGANGAANGVPLPWPPRHDPLGLHHATSAHPAQRSSVNRAGVDHDRGHTRGSSDVAAALPHDRAQELPVRPRRVTLPQAEAEQPIALHETHVRPEDTPAPEVDVDSDSDLGSN